MRYTIRAQQKTWEGYEELNFDPVVRSHVPLSVGPYPHWTR